MAAPTVTCPIRGTKNRIRSHPGERAGCHTAPEPVLRPWLRKRLVPAGDLKTA